MISIRMTVQVHPIDCPFPGCSLFKHVATRTSCRFHKLPERSHISPWQLHNISMSLSTDTIVCSAGKEVPNEGTAGCTPPGSGTGACEELADPIPSEEERMPSTPTCDGASEAAVEKKRRIKEFQCNIMRQVAPAPATKKPGMHAYRFNEAHVFDMCAMEERQQPFLAL